MPADGPLDLIEPFPVLLLRRGRVAMRLLRRLYEDRRVEILSTDELTAEWTALAQRVAGTVVATEGDPLNALGYAITGGVKGPLIVATTKLHRGDSPHLLQAGAALCLLMPLTTADVDRMIPFLHSAAGASRIDATLRLFLDPISRMARYRDREIRLSPREFAVLYCLSSRHGQPVAAEELLTFVWGGASDGSRQILDVYVFQLRRKLARLGLRGAIATVRGYGYTLAAAPGQRTGGSPEPARRASARPSPRKRKP